ncbi:MAG: hypothetical protein FWD71_13530 [Oscillospiraceae bacterium]|nr:hypothetical protein [Oscillospiraceae bacterium]
MSHDTDNLTKIITNSCWRNSYWFARMLLNGDKYGGVGKSKEKQLLGLSSQIEIVLSRDILTESEKITICKDMISKTLTSLFTPNAKGYVLSDLLATDINDEIISVDDVVVFIVAVKYMVAPMNAAMALVPSSDAEFCRTTAKNILDSLGELSVGKVVSTWDDLGVKGCLDVERNLVVSEFTKLRTNLSTLTTQRTEIEDNMILTAFVQEFERRLGQKRKNRAGNSLEDVSTFLFDYYGFKSHPKPDHFQTDIEVDKWFKCKDGWTIGISCKRTLRERWKQVSSADSNALSRYKIREIWHLITYDKDLSDDKLTMLGQQRQIFYLSETTDRYKSASQHIGMCDYVRPLSQFISDIRREQKG